MMGIINMTQKRSKDKYILSNTQQFKVIAKLKTLQSYNIQYPISTPTGNTEVAGMAPWT
jgi:hypothetical protein